MAEKYNPHDYHTKSVFFVRAIEKLRVLAIVRELAPCPQDRILEIGCGAGNLLQQFHGGVLFGLDLSRNLLRLAADKRYEAPCHFLRAYGEAAPFVNETFDKIYCSEVLEHVPKPLEICREAHRLLKKDGRFVVSVPQESTINRFKSLSRKLHIDRLIRSAGGYRYAQDMTEEWHLHSFDRAQLEQILGDFFQVTKVICVPSRWLPVRIVASCRKSS